MGETNISLPEIKGTVLNITTEIQNVTCKNSMCVFENRNYLSNDISHGLNIGTEAAVKTVNPSENIGTGCVLFFIITMTIVGNVVVLVAVTSNKKLRTVSNMFILSLSLADLFVGTIVMIPAAINEIFGEWILHHSFCSIWVSFDVMLTSASVLNVCLISIDRYISIMTPLRYKTIITHRRALYMLLAAWGIAIFSSFVPIISGLHNPSLPTLKNLTLISNKPQCLFIVSVPYAFTASTVTILIPIIIALVLYYRVSKEAKRQALFVGTLMVTSNVLLGKNMTSKHVREPFTHKATVTLGIIVVAYVVTWAPFFITNITESVCECVPVKVFVAFVWLGYCNSLINPIIYPLFMRDFRKVYVKAIYRCCPYFKTLKHFQESPRMCKQFPLRK
ncbi:5-hydroxytryptamine receptor 6-like [Mytilus trossulus]|uniref:5-hydroxytryptamine receptor 6-like n=1 Tax=Mytilus trossulus TaxID=6551 RepID=UPI003005F49B